MAAENGVGGGSSGSGSSGAEYYCLDLARLPDELFKPSVPGADWIKLARTAGAEGFPAGSLAEVAPIPFGALVERLIGFPIYMIMNAAPFMVPPLLYGAFGFRGVAVFISSLLAIHGVCMATNPMKNVHSGQFIFTERHIQKYNSVKWVWPKSMHPPKLPGPKIFCAIPHGLAPLAITGYPMYSKVFGDRLCRWTCAAVVLKLPVISYFLRMIGYVVANSNNIKDVLTKKEESVGIVLDGIAGMFQHGKVEKGFVKSRKGIVKIALTTGTPLVPVYGFGTTDLWRIIVDPLGILEKISLALDVSVTPFCGRPFGLLPFGPPFRVPILVAFGDPVIVPKVEQPTKEQIDEYHEKLMQSYLKVFDLHKAAYGWSDKQLVLV